jgi:hypothetical protein
MLYEHRKEKPLTRRQFAWRVLGHFTLASSCIAFALGIGIVGYHWCAGLPWVDSFLNAAMILSGMGPADELTTTPAKLFAAFYALFSGLLFIAVLGVVLAPFAHRLMHHLHFEDEK